MATSPIYELLPAFKERNRVIFMLMGLLTFSQEWLQLLEEQAASRDPGSANSPAEETSMGFLYFLLGTLSFGGSLEAALESARSSGEAARPRLRQPPAWEDTSDLLR